MKLLKKTLYAYLLAVLWVIGFTSSVYCETNKLLIVHTDWFPYTYQENGKSLGFEIEVFKEVMKQMNIEVEFVEYPWKRCLNALENGSADGLISLLKTPEREKFTYYPDTHISVSKTVFFTQKDKEIQFNGSYEGLKNYRIGVVLGFSYGEAFDKADYLQKDNAVNVETIIKKILAGRNDLGAENQAVINATAIKLGVKDQIKFIEPPIHTNKLYVGFSKAKGHEKLCKDFSKALAEFKATDNYNKILEKYGIDPSEMN